jgi:hypothetical protein
MLNGAISKQAHKTQQGWVAAGVLDQKDGKSGPMVQSKLNNSVLVWFRVD